MKIALAQIQFSLGDFDKNGQKVLEALKKVKNKADLLIFPEGGLWGYPPKDFLYHDHFFKLQTKKLKLIKAQLPQGLQLLLPAFYKTKKHIQNGVFLFEKGKPSLFFAKEFLPNQGVFFESRYFEKGKIENNFFYWKNKKVQILICEDLWQVSSIKNPDIFMILNASPYTNKKQEKRLKKVAELTKKHKCPAVYLNGIGAQDSLIFDGGSFVLNSSGERIWQGSFFKPDFKILSVFSSQSKKKKVKDFLTLQEQRKQALVLGIKSFFDQTGFSKALIGLSGGLDSALVTYLASLALGKKNIKAYFLPGPYTQAISYEIVNQFSKNLKIPIIQKSINPLFNIFTKSFFPKKKANSLILQNAQARIRTLILMAEAAKTSSLLLATGNKSEIATGYSTIYGDLAGALCPIGDLFKTQVYDLVRFINKTTKLFPKNLLLREPSAELSPQQKDSDDLPSYEKLDPLLENLLKSQEPKSLKQKNLSKLIQKQEFKRKQAPPILKISEIDLGESWKKAIAHRFPF